MGHNWLGYMRCSYPVLDGVINYQNPPKAPPDSFPSPSTEGLHVIHSVAAEPEGAAEDRVKLSAVTSKTGKACSTGES